VFVAASTQCFHELPFRDACASIVEVGYDKVELWFDREGTHLDARAVAADPDRFVAGFREVTRLTPIAACVADAEVAPETLRGLAKAAKLLRIAQLTVPASPVGTPFNTEVDRLRAYMNAVTPDGIRLSIKTRAGDLTEDPHTAVELCGSVKGLGLTLDPSYYICGPNAGRDWDVVYPHVYHVHLRDTSPQQIQVPVGLGEVDYNKLITRLEREKHDPVLSVELLADQTDIESRPLEMRKLRMLLDSLL
jgi:sugar phosphate isomerase/epimerase